MTTIFDDKPNDHEINATEFGQMLGGLSAYEIGHGVAKGSYPRPDRVEYSGQIGKAVTRSNQLWRLGTIREWLRDRNNNVKTKTPNYKSEE